MEDEHGTSRAPSGNAKIGPVLEKARKERGLTLEEVEHATKIRKRYLVSLEREDYGVLPDAVYAQGFLKTYANYLGLDGEELARELKDRRRPRRERAVTYDYGKSRTSEFDKPLVSPGQFGRKERRGISAATILTSLVALLALAAVVGSLYYVGRGAQSAGQNPPSQAGVANQQDGNQQDANGQEPEPDGGTPARETPARGTPAGGGGGENAAAAEPRPDSLRVVVSVEGDPSWLSVLVDGELAYEQIAEPGFSRTFEGQRGISIKTGNAGAVGVEVNGQDLGRLGDSGEVLTRDFTLKSAT
jgi:cytoskeleton protein RodZ